VSANRVIGAIGTASLLVATPLCVAAGWQLPNWWALPLLVVGIVLAERTSVRLTIGGEQAGFGVTDACIVVALLLHPGAWVVAGAMVGCALAYPRLPALKMWFNLSQYALGVGVAVAVTMGLGGGVLAAGAGLAAFEIVNPLVVAVAISVSARRPFLRSAIDTGRMSMIQAAGNLSIGLLAAWLADHAPFGLLGLVVPLILLWRSYQQQGERAAEARLFAELARGRDEVSQASLEVSAQVILTAAARLFGGSEVEMVLRHPGGSIRYVGDGRGIARRELAEADAFGEQWVLRALRSRGSLIGLDDGRPFCSAVLGDPGRPIAVLVARRPHGATAFERLDARLAQILAGQAEGWLSASELAARHDVARSQLTAYNDSTRALGDLGASTAPALVVLRESADRLSRLAYSFTGPDPVSDIVDELHAVERAVASLLGAIALASEADLGEDRHRHRPGGRPARVVARAESEWTTTGRLDPADVR